MSGLCQSYILKLLQVHVKAKSCHVAILIFHAFLTFLIKKEKLKEKGKEIILALL